MSALGQKATSNVRPHALVRGHGDGPPPVKFAPELIDCVRVGAAKAGFTTHDLISGAGHDAAYIARVAPTSMIFVPCAGGISHNEAESTSLDDCAAGT
jgi:beta-ureidopropionase / N-carbamoyl-L-amino-acid hydrolase